jgi:hypothetical protein
MSATRVLINGTPRPAVRTSVRTAVVLLAALALALPSCAGPKRLTEQSEKALARGEVDRAYEKARAARKKAPESERARDALAAAGARKLDTLKERVRAYAAASDTLEAARATLDVDAFRRELAGLQVVPAEDHAYDDEAAGFRHAAVRGLVARADDAMDRGRPRDAYHGLEIAREMEPDFPDLDERLHDAYGQALHRIAILPVENQTDADRLGRDVTDLLYREATDRIRQRNFPFTVILPREDVFSQVSVAQAEHMDRADAMAIGRALDADLVVRGRVFGLTSESTSNTWQSSVYRRIAARDTSGRAVDRFDEIPIEVTGRTRHVALRFEFEIRETRHGSIVASHVDDASAAARTVYSTVRADGDCDDYLLCSPPLRRTSSRDADARERAWKEHCGSWELSAFLESARRGTRRAYQSSMRSEFLGDTQARPVFLGDLPPVDDMAAVAVQGVWEPVVDSIRRVER